MVYVLLDKGAIGAAAVVGEAPVTGMVYVLLDKGAVGAATVVGEAPVIGMA